MIHSFSLMCTLVQFKLYQYQLFCCFIDYLFIVVYDSYTTLVLFLLNHRNTGSVL